MRIESGSTSPAMAAATEAVATASSAQDAGVITGAESGEDSALAALSQHALTQTSAFRRHAALRPGRQNFKARSRTRPQEKPSGRDPAIGTAEEAFKQRIGERAHNRQEFHKMMKNIYGDRYDQKTVEVLRQRALSGDFSFLPKARFVSDAALQGNHAAYDAQSGTILLNEKLAGNPQLLADSYAEEAGHHIDTFFGKGDAVGDEGELLRHALAGRELSAAEIAAIRAEDDTGTIIVDGKQIQVEFFFGKIFKGIKKLFKGIGNAFKAIGTWLATSTIGQFLVTAALAALSVVTAGAGTAAMVAWEAAKQAAIAVAKSVIIQKVTGLVGKVTGSETLGRIAGAIGSAFAGGKIDVSSTSTFARTAGSVAKDIAVNEAKRVARNEIVDHTGSPFLQMAAGYAVDHGIEAAGDYAYSKLADPGKRVANDASTRNNEGSVDTSAAARRPDGQSFDVGVYAKKALDRVGKVNVGDVIEQLAPQELRGLWTTIAGRDVSGFTVADLTSAVKAGLDNFERMTAEDVAAAVQDYARNALETVGHIDRAEVARYANAAFDQAGKLKVRDLVQLSGYDGALKDPAINYLARASGTTPAALTLNDLVGLAAGSNDRMQPAAQASMRHRVAG